MHKFFEDILNKKYSTNPKTIKLVEKLVELNFEKNNFKEENFVESMQCFINEFNISKEDIEELTTAQKKIIYLTREGISKIIRRGILGIPLDLGLN